MHTPEKEKAALEQAAQQNTSSNQQCSSIPDAISILQAQAHKNNHVPVMTKQFVGDKVKSYDDGWAFKVHQRQVASLDDLHDLLTKLESRTDCIFVRGAYVGDDKASKARSFGVLRHSVNFPDQPLHTLCCDIDWYEPGFADPVRQPVDACNDFIAEYLPACFHDASYRWHLSSSAGTPGKAHLLKVHLWFWLETPYSTADMKAWSEDLEARHGQRVIDNALYQVVQTHYTANPLFLEGASDPVPVRSGLVRKGTDQVPLILGGDLLKKASERKAGAQLKDPSLKTNLIGLFHRAFNLDHVLCEFLPGEFELGSTERRLTWVNSDSGTPEGAWITDDEMHVGSNHNSWPWGANSTANLWDLVREFKFGHLDKVETDDEFEQLDAASRPVQELPSHKAMVEWVESLDEIKARRAEERQAAEAAIETLLARIGVSSLNDLRPDAQIIQEVKALKEEGNDPGIGAQLDEAIKARFKALKAPMPILDIRRMTRPEVKAGDRRIFESGDHMGIARELAKARFQNEAGHRLAIRSEGAWYRYNGWCYQEEANDEAMRNVIWRFLEKSLRRTEDGGLAAFKPSMGDIGGVIDALRAVLAANTNKPPAWLKDDGAGIDPLNLIVLNNGILDVKSGELLEHTPKLFATNCLPFDFDPTADFPSWRQFLNQLWPDDLESKELLQEWFGYCLTPDTRQQKFLNVVGPKRSGKGTIARVLRELLGHQNMVGTTMASICDKHGMEQWIDKLAVIVSDARGGGKEPQAVVERLLSVSGEDTIPVPRMYRTAWNGKLSVRITIMSNELLRLGDSSGALVGRMLVLKTTRSFFGQEDTLLSEKLTAELPGILNWALAGKARLTQRGHFVQPSSSQDLLQATREANDPVGTFVEEWCEIGPEYEELQSVVFTAWKAWCRNENRQPGTLTVFSKDMSASRPDLKLHRPWVEDRSGVKKQRRVYQGIRILQDRRDEVDTLMFEEQ